MFYRISVAERGLTGIANIFRSRLSGLDDLLRAGTVPLMDNDIRVAHHMRKALDLRLRQAVLTSSMSCRRENQSMDKV